MSFKNIIETYAKIQNLNLSDSQKEYLLNCDDDGILTKQDSIHLKQIGKYHTLAEMQTLIEVVEN